MNVRRRTYFDKWKLGLIHQNPSNQCSVHPIDFKIHQTLLDSLLERTARYFLACFKCQKEKKYIYFYF